VNDILVFVVAGITTGSIYGLIAIGLALTYKTSGILNFAQGALAIVAVDSYIFLTVNLGLPPYLAAVISVLVVGAVVGLAFEVLGRILARAIPALSAVATIGVLLAIQGLSTLIGPDLGGNRPHQVAPPLPGTTIQIAGVNVGEDQLIIMAVTLVAVLALSGFLRVSKVGLALRAVIDHPDLVSVGGRNPIALRRLAWVIGSAFALLSGVLLAIAPTYGPDPGAVASFVVPAFGAAAIGFFTNLPMAYVGGLGIGIVSALLTKYVTAGWLLGLSPSIPLVALLLMLMLTSRHRWTQRRAVTPDRRTATGRAPGRASMPLAGAGLLGLILVPQIVGFQVDVYTTALVYVIIFLSLGLLVRTAAQLSLAHLGFTAIGAATFAHFASSFGMPWPIAVLGAGLVAALVGSLVALCAIRLSGVFFALATLAFGYLLQQLFYSSRWMFGAFDLTAPRPSFAESDRTYYYLVLGILVCVAVLVVAIARTRLGRLLSASVDAPRSLETHGTNVTVAKLLVFAISTFLAGVAGALFASLNNVAEPVAFSAASSLTLVAVLFVLPLAEPWYAFAAAAAFYLFPVEVSFNDTGAWTSFLFGTLSVAAVIISVTQPALLLGRGRAGARSMARHARRLGYRGQRGSTPIETTLPLTNRGATSRSTNGSKGLELLDITVRYGGLVAVNGVSLAAPIGRVTGLIGPNGAGKTTLFDVSSGLVTPAHGSVLFHGDDITALSTPGRARLGLGRTFQQAQLSTSMTVGETVALGCEASLAGRHVHSHVFPRKGDAALVVATAKEALDLVGIGAIVDQRTVELSGGERRLVELARALAGPSDLFLLDEPSAGLDSLEVTHFCQVVRDVVQARGAGVLVVEHDLAVVLGICDYVYVMDFGKVIFEGPPEALRESDEVKRAYLGSS
jgi:ABC-type branched-subunit amino acid transport system ATPase component/branched-subunit amino acid ABC-type transport system permease component